MNKQLRHRRRRRRRDLVNLAVLVLLLILSLSAYGLVRQGELKQVAQPSEQQKVKSRYQIGDSVLIVPDEQLSGVDWDSYKDRVGQISDVTSHKSKYSYHVKVSEDLPVLTISEQNLKQVTLDYILGDNIQTFSNGYLSSQGRVTGISLVGNDFVYEAIFEQEGFLTDIPRELLVTRYQLPLKENYSAKKNNQLLRDAMTKASKNTYTIIDFPKGRFKIGSKKPKKDYLVLSSNISLNGHDTTLVVDGTAYWFGLANGYEATDGLTNFTMRQLSFEASDLRKGDHFMLMANHGYNWLIEDNTFTQVHKVSSHLFDLGAVQNALFQNNQFIGYAPNMTSVTSLPEESLHPIIAEVIQLDSSDDSGVWDAQLIKNIDPNYTEYNSTKHVSANIVISGNQFLPYKDDKGHIVAYSGSIGQHSSKVGYVEITNNTFVSPLVTRFKEQSNDWVLAPIHLPPETVAYVAGNTIDD